MQSFRQVALRQVGNFARLSKPSAVPASKRLFSSSTLKTISRDNRKFYYAGLATAAATATITAYMLINDVNAKGTSAKQKYKYVIVGAGISARSCLSEINKGDKNATPSGYTGKVLMLGNDPRMNSIGYSDKDREALMEPTENEDNELLLGHTCISLNVTDKHLELDDGVTISFDKLYIATGGTHPEMLNVTDAAKNQVTTFHRKGDLQTVVDRVKNGEIGSIAVVGGGALGTELSLALRREGGDDLKISQFYAEPGIMHRNLPDYFRAYNTALLRSKNIEQHNFSLVTKVDKAGDGKLDIIIDSWEQYKLSADHVIFAPTHIDANADLALDAGLEVDPNNSGIVVNSELQAFSDIYVGGDAASYPSSALGRRRDQNYDHAVKTGITAAKNMLGGRVVYNNVPVQKINLEDLKLNYTLIGNADARLETIGFWEMKKNGKRGKSDDQYFFTSKYGKGVLFYMSEGRVVGALLTNIEDPDEVHRCQNLIMDKIDYSSLKRSDLENELREHCGFELQVPLVRSTFGKGTKKKAKRSNPYKKKRHLSAKIQSHPSDTITDANTNLYWRSN